MSGVRVGDELERVSRESAESETRPDGATAMLSFLEVVADSEAVDSECEPEVFGGQASLAFRRSTALWIGLSEGGALRAGELFTRIEWIGEHSRATVLALLSTRIQSAT